MAMMATVGLVMADHLLDGAVSFVANHIVVNKISIDKIREC
jgi:hypothetical protein